MDSPRSRRNPKNVLRIGGGPPPGYLWNLVLLDQAYKEAKAFLNDDQYDHVARQFRELAREGDPTHSQVVDVRTVEDIFEYREKGGILQRLNVRVFFLVHKPSRSIVVLGAIHKQNDGATPFGEKVLMRRRARLYLQSGPSSP